MADYNKLYCYATGKKQDAIVFRDIAKPMSLDIRVAVKPVSVITVDTVAQLFELTVFDSVDNFLINSTFQEALREDWLKVYNEFAVEILLPSNPVKEILNENIDDRLSELVVNSDTIEWKYNDKNNQLSAKVKDETSVQKIIVQKNSTRIGKRKELNIIEGSNITLDVEDDVVNNKINITISTPAGVINDLSNASDETLSAQKINNLINDVELSFSGKAHVEVVTEGLGNQASLTGTPIIHGYQTLNGDRIGLTEQTDLTENGIYVIGTPWVRATDFDGTPNGEVKAGTFFFVSTNDNTYAGYRFFVIGSDENINVGTENIEFDFNAPSVTAETVQTNQANTYDNFAQIFRSSQLKLTNPANTFSYSFVGSAILADRNLTVPLITADDTLIVQNLVQALHGKTLSWNFTNLANQEAYGEILVATVGGAANFVFGETGGYTTGGVVIKGNATSGSVQYTTLMCIEPSGITVGNSGRWLRRGIVRNDSWAFTTGNAIYQGKTGGAIVNTVAAYTAGDMIQKLAHCYGLSTVLDFNPSMDYVIKS